MAATPVAARCPTCGTYLASYAPPGRSVVFYRCPHCSAPVPIVPPREPPPMFASEVYPSLYAMGSPTGVAPRSGRKIVSAALIAALLIVVGVAGFLFAAGTLALEPGRGSVAGFVYSATGGGRVGPVTIVLTGENGYSATQTTLDGSFSFTSVPDGGIALNATVPGFDTTVLTLFLSPVYTSGGSNPRSIELPMTPGNESNMTYVSDTPFATLESFVASMWSATILLAVGAAILVLGIITARRRGPVARVAAASGVAVTAAFVAPLTAVDAAFPSLDYVGAALAAVGSLALIVTVIPMMLLGGGEAEPAEPPPPLE